MIVAFVVCVIIILGVVIMIEVIHVLGEKLFGDRESYHVYERALSPAHERELWYHNQSCCNCHLIASKAVVF